MGFVKMSSGLPYDFGKYKIKNMNQWQTIRKRECIASGYFLPQNIIISYQMVSHSKSCDFLVVAMALPPTSVDEYSNCLKKSMVVYGPWTPALEATFLGKHGFLLL